MRLAAALCKLCHALGVLICAALFGGFALFFLTVITWGAIWFWVAGFAILATVILGNYLLWGWWVARPQQGQGGRSHL